MIELSTLGRLEVRVDRREVACPRKPTLLLVLLADSPRLRNKDASELLWPDAEGARRLHSLNQALYTLRRIFGRRLIENTDSSMQFSVPFTWDYQEVLRLIEAGDLIGACAMSRGPFLSGIEISQGRDFEEWREQRAAFLSARLHAALDKETTQAQQIEQWKRVKDLAVEGIRLFPQSLQFRLATVKALVGLDQPNDARRVHESLAAAVRSGTIDGTAGEVPSFDSLLSSVRLHSSERSSLANVQFVGRERELNSLENALLQAESGRGRIVAVSGTAGIGKTTLCNVFAARAARRNVRLIVGTAYPTERHLGYNVITEALQHEVKASDVDKLPPNLQDALQEILPDIYPDNHVPRTTHLGYEAAQRRLFEAITRLVQAMSGKQTVLFLIDDTHWADDATLAWLNYFSRRINNNRILLLVTMRLEERPRLLATDMPTVKALDGSELELEELSEAETASLVRMVRPDWNDYDLIATLRRTTGGHPLLISEALKASSRGDALIPAQRGIKYFSNQLRLLKPEHRMLLEWLAVAGTPLPIRVLSAIATVTAPRLGQDLEYLGGFCKVLPGNMLAFKHDLIRESVYQAIQRDKRIALHGELAEVLQANGASASILALHFHEAGLKNQASRYALEAAAQSELMHAYSDAEHFYRLALGTVEVKEDEIALTSRLADMLFRSGSYGRALPLLATLSAHYADEPWAFLHWEWKHLKSILATGATDANGLFSKARSLELQAREHGHADALFAAVDVQSTVAHVSYPIWTEELPRLREAFLSLSQRFPLTQ